MAANVTRLELRDRIRFEADMVNSTRATDAQINVLINTHLAELYDRLVACGPPDYYATSTTVTTVSGTVAYALPATFRSLIGVFLNDGTRRLEIPPMKEGLRGMYDAPQGVVVLTLEFVPVPVMLTSESTAITGTVDGVSGWDELIVQLVARALRQRDGRDVSAFNARVQELRGRVMANAPRRNQSGPRYVKDTEAVDAWSYFGRDTTVTAWRLTDGYLNLYGGAVSP